jgi:hypothetical protein
MGNCTSELLHGGICIPACDQKYTRSFKTTFNNQIVTTPGGVTQCAFGNFTVKTFCEQDLDAFTYSVTPKGSAWLTATGYPYDHICVGADVVVTVNIPSNGPGGLGLQLDAKVIDVSSGNTVKMTKKLNSTNKIQFTIPSAMLAPGGHGDGVDSETWNVELTVQDFVNRQNPALSTTTKGKKFVVHYKTPPVSILQGSSAQMHRYQALIFGTKLAKWAHSCIVQGKDAKYAWSITNASGGLLPYASTGTGFIIPKNTLRPLQSYQVKLVTSYDGELHSEHTQKVAVNVVPSPISVRIREGPQYRVYTHQLHFLIHADATDLDPLVFSNNEVTYTWTLTSPNKVVTLSEAGATSLSQGAVLNVSTAQLSSSCSPCTFTVQVSKVGGLVNATTAVSLTTTAYPVVGLTRSGQVVFNRREYLSIQSDVSLKGAACPTCTFGWTTSSSTLNLAAAATDDTKTLDKTSLVLKKDMLTAGSTFTFTLTVTVPGSGVTTAQSIQVEVNAPPQAGSVTGFAENAFGQATTNTTGVFFSTPFMITATGFTDAHTPLMYKFGYWLKSSSTPVLLTSGKSDSTYSTTMLPMGEMTPYVEVTDKFGATTAWPTSLNGATMLTITPPTVAAGQAVEVKMLSTLNTTLSASSNPVAKMSILAGMAASFNQVEEKSTAAKDADKAARTQMAQVLNTAATAAGVSTEQVVATASSISKEHEALTEAAQTALNSAVKSALTAARSITPDTGFHALTALSNAQKAATLGFTDIKTNANTKAKVKHLASELEENLLLIGTKVAEQMSIGQPAAVLKTADSTIEQTIAKHDAASMIGKEIAGCTLAVNPIASSQRSTAPVVTSVVHSQTSTHADAQANSTNAIASYQTSVVMMKDGTEISLSGMTPPATITVKSASTLTHPVCAYLNEATRKWDRTGVEYDDASSTSGSYKCLTSHLTDFGVQEGAPVTSGFTGSSFSAPTPAPTAEADLGAGWIALIVCGVVLFLALCVFVIYDMNKGKPVQPQKEVDKSQEVALEDIGVKTQDIVTEAPATEPSATDAKSQEQPDTETAKQPDRVCKNDWI